MANKFKIGDKVVIRRHNDRTPKELLRAVRLDHPRTITGIFYDDKAQHTRYYLGSNKRGNTDLQNRPLRASELNLWNKGKVGRPRQKRTYKRHLVILQGV